MKESKISLLLTCFLVVSSLIVSVYAQTGGVDLTGTWESTANGMYYNLDPTDPTLRMHDVTATFSMEITQTGNQITIILHLNMIDYTVTQAYLDEYGFGIPAVAGGAIRFVGTVSGSGFTTFEQDTSYTPEQLVETFTGDTITAMLKGEFEVTDPDGIVVKKVGSGSPTKPTVNPSLNPSSTGEPKSILDRVDPALLAVAITFIIICVAGAIRSTRTLARNRQKRNTEPPPLPPPPPPP